MRNADAPNADAAVLVVDDDRTMRLMARQALELKGFAVHEAEDGVEALARFEGKRHPGADDDRARGCRSDRTSV
jgi:CheY-like chemotaxis protein